MRPVPGCGRLCRNRPVELDDARRVAHGGIDVHRVGVEDVADCFEALPHERRLTSSFGRSTRTRTCPPLPLSASTRLSGAMPIVVTSHAWTARVTGERGLVLALGARDARGARGIAVDRNPAAAENVDVAGVSPWRSGLDRVHRPGEEHGVHGINVTYTPGTAPLSVRPRPSARRSRRSTPRWCPSRSPGRAARQRRRARKSRASARAISSRSAVGDFIAHVQG